MKDAQNVQEYVLEWIIRCRPSFVLPVSCCSDSGQVRLLYHTECLTPLTNYARDRLAAVPFPSQWIRSVLNAIRETLSCAEDYLLDVRQFRLDTASVWFRQSVMETDVPQPILTFLPIHNARPEGGLAVIANGLLEIMEALGSEMDPDGTLTSFRLAVQLGDDHLCAFLEQESISEQTVREQDPSWVQNPSDTHLHQQSGGPPKAAACKRLARRVLLPITLGIPLLLAVFPLVLRFGPEPVRRLATFSSTGYRTITAASLGLTAVFDAIMLFAPFSPFRFSKPNTASPPIGTRGRRGGYLKVVREEIRLTGLLPALAARLGKSGRLGAMTHPLTQDDGSGRLGFLSEGEPGTANEAEGIRAYLLTAEFLIGRDPDIVDLAVPDAAIGRVHARITRQDGSFFITDLGSVNGTRLDGKRLDRHEQMLLPDRCLIQFAEREFHFLAD